MHLSTFVAERNLCRLFISEVRTASDYRGSAIQQLNRRYTSILIKMVDDAVTSGEIPRDVDPRVVRDMLFGAIEHSAWRHTIAKRPLDVAGLARSITDIFLNGLCPAPRRVAAVTQHAKPGPDGGWPFDRVLIANRGEIALRILRTVQALGLEAVVVHHAADAGTPAVLAADRAIEISGSTPVAAYLDGGQIVAAARESGTGAIHPGYGFLSENAHFARQVGEAGLVFGRPDRRRHRTHGRQGTRPRLRRGARLSGRAVSH